MEAEIKSLYKVLWYFIKEHIFMAVLFGIFSAIFAIVFSLYDLQAEAVLYAMFLCILVSAVIFLICFSRYYKSYVKRQKLLKNIEIEYDNLPNARTLAESDYLDMVYSIGEINVRHLTENKEKEQENIDYYTTWVHQIKTPISVMRMILSGEDTQEHHQLSDELFRIEQYVGMVLSYLRLGSNTTDYVFGEYSLDRIIKEAIHKYASIFVRKRLKLVYEPTDEKVLTDEKWLSFIIEQILSNALKYTNTGVITISVSPDKVLSIKDTGIGIAPEDLPRIFEKGFTGYNGRSDKKSTGLGLYLCRQAADRLSIKISAKSAPGVGTEFMLDLKMNKLEVE